MTRLRTFLTYLAEPATTLSPRETAWCALAGVAVALLAVALVYGAGELLAGVL
jgi:hypothetical protein